MVSTRWQHLTPRTRRVILTAAAVEGILKVAALEDLRRRPEEQIRGSKKRWRTAIILVNSAGAVPLAYFLKGRRTDGRDVQWQP